MEKGLEAVQSVRNHNRSGKSKQLPGHAKMEFGMSGPSDDSRNEASGVQWGIPKIYHGVYFNRVLKKSIGVLNYFSKSAMFFKTESFSCKFDQQYAKFRSSLSLTGGLGQSGST